MTLKNQLAQAAPQATTPVIQLYGQSLPPQERSRHRAWIGIRVEALLDGYWQNRPSELVKAQIMADWMAILETYTEAEITEACRWWLATNPRKKPQPGDIRAHIVDERKKAIASQPKPVSGDVLGPRISKERASEIMAEVYGATPDNFKTKRESK